MKRLATKKQVCGTLHAIMAIKEGERAPEFTLKNQNGEPVSLANVAGKKVVVYFYPKDDTPGCTLEGQEFSALQKEFEKYNTIVFGVSKDTVDSHSQFCNKYDFSIDLLSDEDGTVLRAYGALQEQGAIVRSTVLIDENTNIQKHWDNVQPQGHAQQVLDTLKNAHSDSTGE